MTLPDPAASRAVLIGSCSYRELAPLPAVAGNLERLSELFMSEDLWGLPPRNCVVLADPPGPADVLDAIHAAAGEASDTLLVYYAGHGLVDPHTDELYLALPGSSPERLYSAVRFDDVRRELIAFAGASSKVVILDCCYSGRAMAGGMSGPAEMADQARIEGTYLMTASAETVRAQAPEGEPFTAFTGELIAVLEQGIPEGPDLLNAETLYWHVRRELAAKLRPTPQQRAGNDGGMIALARNRRATRKEQRAAGPRERLAELPGPPEGLEALMSRPPREIAEEAARLSSSGRAPEATRLLTAAGARGDDQEVAALIGNLREAGGDAGIDIVTRGVALRPAAEAADVLDALRQMGMAPEADRLLQAVAQGPAGDAGQFADVLARRGGRDADIRRVLDLTIAAHRDPEETIDLLAVLLPAGLGHEAGRLLDIAGEGMTAAETAALADALRGAGLQDAAFRLYAAARSVVANRPAAEAASVLRSLRDARRDEDAAALLEQIIATGRGPGETASLVTALWSGSLGEDAGQVLAAVASSLPPSDIASLARAVRAAGRHDAALRLSADAAARQPVSAAVTLARTLRDDGRPIDALSLLDSSREWPPARRAELINALREHGQDSDADRVLDLAAQSDPGQLPELMTVLRSGTDVIRLAAAAPASEPAATAAVITTLLRRDLTAAAEQLITTAAACPVTYRCDLLSALRDGPMPEIAGHLLREIAEHDAADIAEQLTTLRDQARYDDLSRLLAFCAQRQPAAVTEILTRLPGLPAAIIQNFRLFESLARPVPQPLIAALRPTLETNAVYRNRFLITVADQQPAVIATLVPGLQEHTPAAIPLLMPMIIAAKNGPELAAVLATLKDTQQDAATASLLTAAAAASKDKLTAIHDALIEAGQASDAEQLYEKARRKGKADKPARPASQAPPHGPRPGIFARRHKQ